MFLSQEARVQLEQAAELAAAAGSTLVDFDFAEIRYRLGRCYWALGGDLKTDRSKAHAHWLAAAAISGPAQGSSFAWLGHYYSQVAGDALRARKCFQRALAVDPSEASAGESLPLICEALKAVAGFS